VGVSGASAGFTSALASPSGRKAREVRLALGQMDGDLSPDQTVCRRHHHRNSAGRLVSRQVGVDITPIAGMLPPMIAAAAIAAS
jgi:hypothetical protein